MAGELKLLVDRREEPGVEVFRGHVVAGAPVPADGRVDHEARASFSSRVGKRGDLRCVPGARRLYGLVPPGIRGMVVPDRPEVVLCRVDPPGHPLGADRVDQGDRLASEVLRVLVQRGRVALPRADVRVGVVGPVACKPVEQVGLLVERGLYRGRDLVDLTVGLRLEIGRLPLLEADPEYQGEGEAADHRGHGQPRGRPALLLHAGPPCEHQQRGAGEEQPRRRSPPTSPCSCPSCRRRADRTRSRAGSKTRPRRGRTRPPPRRRGAPSPAFPRSSKRPSPRQPGCSPPPRSSRGRAARVDEEGVAHEELVDPEVDPGKPLECRQAADHRRHEPPPRRPS